MLLDLIGKNNSLVQEAAKINKHVLLCFHCQCSTRWSNRRGPKAPFPVVGYAGIQPAIRKRVPAGAPVGAGSY